MASVIDYMALPDCFGRPTCDPAPVCPACGGLECLCRPRFFAGQLLTEDDLNRAPGFRRGEEPNFDRDYDTYVYRWYGFY